MYILLGSEAVLMIVKKYVRFVIVKIIIQFNLCLKNVWIYFQCLYKEKKNHKVNINLKQRELNEPKNIIITTWNTLFIYFEQILLIFSIYKN